MRLYRRSVNPDRATAREHTELQKIKGASSPEDKWRVDVRFPEFGSGSYRSNDFDVEVRWEDVEELVAKFVDMGHAEAVKVQNSRQLIRALRSVLTDA